MSLSEKNETELQDLIKQVLEKTGCLSKIRAELRARIFLALEQGGDMKNEILSEGSLKNIAANPEFILAINLFKDFLSTLQLSFTNSVFGPELSSCGVLLNEKSRTELIEELNISPVSDKAPLIFSLLRKSNINGIQHQSDDMIMDSREAPNKVNRRFAQSNSRNNIPDNLVDNDIQSERNLENGKSERIHPDKLGSSALRDLPPLQSVAADGMSLTNSTFMHYKHMSKLKAMLLDSSSDVLSTEEILPAAEVSKESDTISEELEP